MSFPSAIEHQRSGLPDDEALMRAVQEDTSAGFQAVRAVTAALREGAKDPIAFVRGRLADFGETVTSAVLRSEPHRDGLKVDFDPNSDLGRQISRIMGTDAVRPLLANRLETALGFANCCGIIAGRTAQDVVFTAGDQIRWQASIDC